MHKKVDDAFITFETWKSKVEESIREKDALIEDLKKQLAIFKENLDTIKASLKSSAQPQLQEEVKELNTNVKNGLRAWSNVVKQHEENIKWIDMAKKKKPSTTPSTLSIINDTLEEEKRRIVRAMNGSLSRLCPYESWYDKKPSASYLRVFGCLAYAHIPQQLRGKLDDKAVKCIFVGYSSGSKGYKLYHPATNKIFESRDVIFAETTAQPMVAFDVPHMQTQDVFEGFLPSFVEKQESQQVDNFDQSFDQHVTPHDVEKIVHEEQEVLREERTLPKWVQKTLQDSKLDAPLPRKTRAGTTFGREQVDLACFSTLCDADEPDSFEQALECVQWKDVMQQEIDSIHKNHTWDLVDLPAGKKPIGTKWVFKVKRKQDGTVDRYKARLVAKGYAQKKGIDYDETFAPTSRASTVRSLVAIAAHHNWKVHQLDIKTAFLNGDLQEEVNVSQPSGFVVKGQEQKVCRLRKALYGLKQAPRAWYEKIHTYLIGQGFQNSPTESTLYVKKRDAVLIMLTLYVNDMLLTGNNKNENAAFKDALRKTFEMFDLAINMAPLSCGGTSQAKLPWQILCLVIGYSFFKSFNPFLAYSVPYMVQIKGLTNFQITNKVYPISSYAILVFILLAAPACEIRGKSKSSSDRMKKEKKEKQVINSLCKDLSTVIPQAPSWIERMSWGNREDHDHEVEAPFTDEDYNKRSETFWPDTQADLRSSVMLYLVFQFS
ncbi:hypothetical protein L7F22_003406 [Adiantum nelumboides]|nr:hypothetical protein [Adiantum nelumboides]